MTEIWHNQGDAETHTPFPSGCLLAGLWCISCQFADQPVPEERSMNLPSGNGIITLHSRHSVDQTVQELERVLDARAVKLFTIIDHSGEAQKAGLEMRPTKLLIFGSPKAGTPLMIA